MEASRRSFLKGALAVSALAVTGLPVLASYPVLYGDGIHDDTASLTALLNGKKVICEGEVLQVEAGHRLCLKNSRFLLADTVTVGPSAPGWEIDNLHMVLDMNDSRPAFYFNNA